MINISWGLLLFIYYEVPIFSYAKYFSREIFKIFICLKMNFNLNNYCIFNDDSGEKNNNLHKLECRNKSKTHSGVYSTM